MLVLNRRSRRHYPNILHAQYVNVADNIDPGAVLVNIPSDATLVVVFSSGWWGAALPATITLGGVSPTEYQDSGAVTSWALYAKWDNPPTGDQLLDFAFNTQTPGDGPSVMLVALRDVDATFIDTTLQRSTSSTGTLTDTLTCEPGDLILLSRQYYSAEEPGSPTTPPLCDVLAVNHNSSNDHGDLIAHTARDTSWTYLFDPPPPWGEPKAAGVVLRPNATGTKLRDAFEEYANAASHTTTATITPAGDRRYGIVKVGFFDLASITEVLWGATDITANVILNLVHDGSDRKRYAWFYILDPPTTPATISVTKTVSSAMTIAAEAWDNVNQAAPYADLTYTPNQQDEAEDPATLEIVAAGGKTLNAGWYLWHNGTEGVDNTYAFRGDEQIPILTSFGNFGGGADTGAHLLDYLESDGHAKLSYKPEAGLANLSAIYALSFNTDNTLQPHIIGSVSKAGNGGASTYQWSHTVPAGNNKALIVALIVDRNSQSISSAQYAGEDLTLIGSEVVSTYQSMFLYGLVDPPVGTANVTITWGAATYGWSGCAFALNNVDQSAPFGTAQSKTTSSQGVTQTLGPFTTNKHALIIDVLGDRGASIVDIGDQDAVVAGTFGTYFTASVTTKRGGAAVSMERTFSGNPEGAWLAAAVNPVSAEVAAVNFYKRITAGFLA